MKIAILTNAYPHEKDLYKNGFVHQRNIAYRELGHTIEVFVIQRYIQVSTYSYHGIKVIKAENLEILEILNESSFDCIFVHFYNRHIGKILETIDHKKVVIFIHGIEALSILRRLYNLSIFSNIPRILVSNYLKLKRFRAYTIKNNVSYVFVSEWMRKTSEKDIGVKFNKFHIIPNYINNELFVYLKKNADLRKNILIIKNFNSKKYATDIIFKSLLLLTQKKYFKNLKITIYGEGRFFKKHTQALKNFSNIKIYNKFLPQAKIPDIHKKNGVLLAPTRQDSQGVSMCEAMSSGLVPITSSKTAIPEFVSETEGFLTNNKPSSIVKAIDILYHNPKLFEKMSYNSSIKMKKICGKESTILKELELVNNA